MSDENVLKEPSNIYLKVGKFEDPTAYSKIKGICGDETEFYLIIKNNIIKSIGFLTTDCYFTTLCGNAVACEAEGKNIIEALKVNPGQILSKLGKLPKHHYHCTILAVSTLYKAIAGYLFEKIVICYEAF
ncbi:MAG: iron-sulfur cluster assembly scaffold protein [Lentisphaerae bacterium]|nr:iron-sulfur cluster assembly scaffold protein [Lentisphaerota bacterium]MCP4102390.1 iron-sulfur cluster assembly scaffold protein [Lentisphaerota bacterium]